MNELNEALLAHTDRELEELGGKDEPHQELPKAVKQFLARAGLSLQDLRDIGLEPTDIGPMLRASRLKYLRLSQVDNFTFKLLMLPVARAWPRSKSLLFPSPWVLRQAYMTNDYLNGVRTVATPLSSGITYAAILMDVVNHASCPQGSKAEALLLLLGISSRSHILSRLLSSRNTAYVPSLLFGLPLVWGSAKALIGALDARPLTRKRAKAVIEALQNYQPHLWQDFGRWLLPFSSLERNFNQLVRALTFDGREVITADERYHMTIALTQLARHAQGFTQLNAMEGLAEIVNGIALKDFGYLKPRFNSKTRAAVLFSKQQALATLRKLADNYRLEPSQSGLRPLIRYVYANYLLWYVGQPATLSLRPLFWAVEGAKAYATLSIVTALIRATVEAIQQLVKKKQCESAGKMYSFVASLGDYACTLCADLVSYSDSLTDESCFNAFLRHPKPVQATLMAIQRFKLINIKALNLVPHRLNSEDLGQVLRALTAKNATFDNVELYWEPSLRYSNQTIEAITQDLPALQLEYLKLNTGKIDYLMASAIERILSLKVLDLTNNGLTDDKLMALNGHYPPNLQELRLSYNKLSLNQVNLASVFQGPLKYLSLIQNNVPSDNLRKLYPLLQQSNLAIFAPPILTGQSNITEYLEHLPWATLRQLAALPGYYDAQAVEVFTQAISRSRLVGLSISLTQFEITDPRQFAERIMRPSLTFLEIVQSDVNDEVYREMAPLLHRTKELALLSIMNSPLTDKGLVALGHYLPQSNLNVLRLNTINITCMGVKALMQGAQYTDSLSEIQLGHNKLGDDSAGVIADYLPRHLKRLELGYNEITGTGAAKLAAGLRFSNVSTLGIAYNQLGDMGAIQFARTLHELPSLTRLELSGNCITDRAAIELAQYLHNVTLSSIWLDNNAITDLGGISLALALIKPACQRPINIEHNAARLGTRQTNLTSLLLAENPISTIGTQKLCKALMVSQIPLEELMVGNTWQWSINTSLVDVKTCYTSSASSLRAPWPYLMLYNSYQAGLKLAMDGYRQFLQPRLAIASGVSSQAPILTEESAWQPGVSVPSLTHAAAYGALCITVGYLVKTGLSSVASWWTAKPKDYLAKAEIDLALASLNHQAQALNSELTTFYKYSLSKSQKTLLDYLEANLADHAAEQDEFKNKKRVTAEQLQILGDELEDIAYGIEELRQELEYNNDRQNSLYKMGLFAHKPTLTEHSTPSNYSYTM